MSGSVGYYYMVAERKVTFCPTKNGYSGVFLVVGILFMYWSGFSSKPVRGL
jgi:hypothetical protein